MEQEMTGDMMLGSQSVTRVLIITHNAGANLEAAQGIRAILEQCNHQVSIMAADAWRDSITLTAPEVVLLDSPPHLDAAGLEKIAGICRQIKSLPDYGDVPVVVVLPSGDAAVKEQSWAALQSACVDDLWSADTSRVELEVRVELLSRLAHLSRDLRNVRDLLSKHLQIDEATQLLTRRFFFQAAFREVSRARRYGHHLSALMIDIDFLDNINRKFGDTCGDYVLRAVAYVVRQWTRDSDTVARFSDHKFVALLPETTIENATRVREKIMRAISETKFEWHGQELPVSVSIGEASRLINDNPRFAAQPTEQDEDPEAHSLSVREELAALLEDADAALSVTKKTAKRPEIFIEYSPGTIGLPGPE